jgi:NAD(P)-dependent dehydrogenase (short-subunit alcohol dehydrogenase family)
MESFLRALEVDLSTPAGPGALVDHALSERDGIDILINNAGSFTARTGKSLAEELVPKGVRVNTVSPGPTLTSAWESPGGFGEAVAKAGDLSLAQFLSEFPAKAGLTTGRMTKPEEVAAVVVLLASDRVANAAGVDYAIDGGLLKAV